MRAEVRGPISGSNGKKIGVEISEEGDISEQMYSSPSKERERGSTNRGSRRRVSIDVPLNSLEQECNRKRFDDEKQ